MSTTYDTWLEGDCGVSDETTPDEGFSDEVIAEVLGESSGAAETVLEAAIFAARTGDIGYLQRTYERVAFPILLGVVA